jgi:hypothetical protein
VYVSRVDPSGLPFSLSSHRYSCIGLFNSRLSLNKQFLHSRKRESVNVVFNRMLPCPAGARSLRVEETQDFMLREYGTLHTPYPLHLTTVRTYTLKLPYDITQMSHEPRII